MSKASDKNEVEELVEILAYYYPAAKQAIEVLLAVRKWAKQLEYPVNSFIDLAKQMHRKPVQIEEKPINLENITGPIPSYYFPIASYENLIEKVNELYRIKVGQNVRPGPSLPAVDPSALLARSFPAPFPRPPFAPGTTSIP